MQEKTALRAELTARRAGAFAAFPDAAARLVEQFPLNFTSLSIVAGYMPVRTEIDPLPLLRHLHGRDAQIAMPTMNSPSPLWGRFGMGGTAANKNDKVAENITAPHPPALSPPILDLERGRGDALNFHLCDIDKDSDFQTNKWGVREPKPNLPVAMPTILLVPLLGFDRHGHRLGYGKGYYDQALSTLRAQTDIIAIGLAFAAQEVSAIPTQPHDQRLDWIITQNEAYRVPS